MPKIDFIVIAQSEVVSYSEYSKLPLDRPDLWRENVFPRMVHYKGAFRSHLDLLNLLGRGQSIQDAPPEARRDLLSVWNLPSLSGMHLANYLLGKGLHTCIINNFDAEWDRLREAYRNADSPPLVGISTTFHLGWAELRRIIRRLRELDREMTIVVGGAFVNGLTQTAPPTQFEKPMRKYGIDYILHGFHSEKDLCDLLLAHHAKSELGAVGNLVFLMRAGAEREFRVTESRWNKPLLDLQPALWHELEVPFVRRTVQARTSCGCAFCCAFCSYPEFAHGFQTMGLPSLERSLRSLIRIPGVDRMVFVDDTFNVPPKRFKEMCRLFARLGFRWYSFLRANLIDEETVQLMSASGCQAVYLGIESANDQVLANMNKRATAAAFRRGVELLRRYGIVSVAAFVLGFPGETEETVCDDLAFVEDLGVEFFTLKEFYYTEWTRVHADRERYGLSGMGNRWSHATMDSRQAYEHKLFLFRSATRSCFLDADSSLWYLVALQDAGFTFAEAAAMQRLINSVVRDQLDGRFDDRHESLLALQTMLTRSQEARQQ